MTVAVFVDCQKDFLRGGKLGFAYPEADNFGKVLGFAKHCVKQGWKAYATRDTHEATKFNSTGGVDSGYLATLEGRKLPVEHCVEMTNGWMLDDKLMAVLDGKCAFINKPTFGSFDLAGVIAEDYKASYDHKPLRIYICGYDLSICVMANAVILRAKFPDADIIVLSGACGDVSKETYEAAMKVLGMQQVRVLVVDDPFATDEEKAILESMEGEAIA